MIKRSIAASAVILGLATVAHANLIVNRSKDLVTPLGVQASAAGSHKVDGSANYVENKSLTPTAVSDINDGRQLTKSAPRVVELPRVDAPGQGYIAPIPATGSVNRSEEPSKAPTSLTSRESRTTEGPLTTYEAIDSGRVETSIPSTGTNADRSSGYHKAKWVGGEGGTWRTGQGSYSFSGRFGGCRITGSAGPHGYRLDRAC